jgi:glycosyltransferase involved in cell wall biosynthesis
MQTDHDGSEGLAVSIIAWGDPSDRRTFSGYSRYLTQALRRRGVLRREISARNLTPLDALRGAVRLRLAGGRPHAELRRKWMWSERGTGLLNRRLDSRLRAAAAVGPFLQVGTLVSVAPSIGDHYLLTDMTIPQAERAGMFAVGRLSPRDLAAATAVQRRVLHEAKHVFTLTEWARQSVIDDFSISPVKVTAVYAGSNLLIPDGVTEPRVDREILFVGIDWTRKGGPMLLEALRLLSARLPGVTLRIVGCSPNVDVPGVHVEGYLDKADQAQYERLARFYLRASCFCLPSLFDPFPNAIIEAASVGLPTVAIDNGSRREAVVDGETGRLAQASPGSLADALFDVMHDGDRCRAMGLAARRHAEANFTWDHVVDRILAVMQGRPAIPTAGDRPRSIPQPAAV